MADPNDLLTQSSFDEPLYRLQEKKLRKKLFLILMIIFQFGDSLDEIFWTPLRDLQVFGKKIFGSAFGASHSLTNILVLVSGLIANLPFLAKVFNKNEVNTLQEVLENCERECGEEFFEPNRKDGKKVLQVGIETKLKTEFNDDLKKKERNYFLEAKIETNTRRRVKNRFKKEEYVDLKYQLSGNFKKLLSGKPGENVNTKLSKNFTFTDVFHELFNQDISAEVAPIPIVINHFTKLMQKIDADYQLPEYDQSKPKELNAALKQVLDDLVNAISNNKKKELKEQLTEDEREKIVVFAKIAPIFFEEDGTLARAKTITESREEFLKKVNSFSIKKFLLEMWNGADNAAFKFWLAALAVDTCNASMDNRIWDLPGQILAVIGAGLGVFFTEIGLRIANFFKNKVKPKKDLLASETTNSGAEGIVYVNDSIKHRQLQRFYIRSSAKNYKKIELEQIPAEDQAVLQPERNKILELSTLEDLKAYKVENADLRKQVEQNQKENKKNGFFKNLWKGFLSEADDTEEYFSDIEDMIYDRKNFNRRATGVATVARHGIKGSFIQWYAGALVYLSLVLGHAKTAAEKVGAFFSDGWVGALFQLGSVIVGFLVGYGLYKKSVKNELEKEKENLKALYEAKQRKIDKLLLLEAQNKKLMELLEAKGVVAQLIFAIHDIRAFRRLTNTKTPKFTILKKSINRFSMAIGRAGSGILLFRIVPMVGIPLLAKIAVITHIAFLHVIIAAVASVAMPIAIVAVVFGLIWAGIFTYKYIKESKMKSAKRLLNDLDSHLLCSKENQKILLRQLGSENNDVQPEPPRDQAEVRVEQNNEAEQQPPEILPQNPEVPPPQNPVVPLPQNPVVPLPQNPVVPPPQNPVVPDPNNQNQGQDDLVENVNVITTADVPQQITHEAVSVASHHEKPAEPTPVIKEDNKQDIAVAKVPAVPEHLPDQKVIYTEVYYPKGAFFQKDPNQCSKELMLKNILTTFLAESKQAESKNGFGERTVESDEQQQQIRTIPVC